MTIVYLANSFPEQVEPYIWEEVQELRHRGIDVVPCSIRHPQTYPLDCPVREGEIEYAFPLHFVPLLSACWLLIFHFLRIRDLILRAVRGPERIHRRLRTIAHTFLGAYLAARFAKRNIRHIHVHHAYFGSWVGMVAARLLGAGFSMTLHGSDLLVRRDYLDTKLAACDFCFTVSEFNRRHILGHYPVAPGKVLLRRLGIDPASWQQPALRHHSGAAFSILSVGRLHPVKNRAFLLLACHALKAHGVDFHCTIVGGGEERASLEAMIERTGLQAEVELRGHVPRQQLPAFYMSADVVVLTSHSEGIPVTLMEAMALKRIVIAPRITGIPELITDGVDGFLYSPGSLTGLMEKLEIVRHGGPDLRAIEAAAREQIERNFNGPELLAEFAAEFLARTPAKQLATHQLSPLNEIVGRGLTTSN